MKSPKPENVKKLLQEQTKEIRRHMGVLKEDFSGQLKIVAEMVAGVAETQTIMKQDIEFMKAHLMRKVDYEEFSALTRRVSRLEEKVK